jgi:hypothetical protein
MKNLTGKLGTVCIGAIGAISGGILLFSTAALAVSADSYVQEARELSQAGDLAGAAVSYQKALKLDQQHSAARRELKNVLIESKRQDPHGEYSEAEWALLEHNRTSPKAPSLTPNDSMGDAIGDAMGNSSGNSSGSSKGDANSTTVIDPPRSLHDSE